MPLDLEEQEQLDSLKAFWEKYRSLIMGAVTVVLFVFAAYNGWQWWKNSQATEAGKLYETMMSSIEKGNKEQSMQAADDLQKQFAGTSYAPMASLIAAKLAADAGDAAKSQAYLRWVAEKAANDGYQALGKLRLATALMDEGSAKSLAEADTILKGSPTPDLNLYGLSAAATGIWCKVKMPMQGLVICRHGSYWKNPKSFHKRRAVYLK